MSRREFTPTVYAQIVKRAMQPSGDIACEGCGLVLGRKPYHVDHTVPDALQVDKTKRLTADDGKLLGVECCHKPKTATIDIPAISKAKRNEARNLGIKRPAGKIPSAPFASTEKAESRSSKQQLPRRSLYAEAKP